MGIGSKFHVYKKELATSKKDNLHKIVFLRDTKDLFYPNQELRDTYVIQEFVNNEMSGKFEMQKVLYRDPDSNLLKIFGTMKDGKFSGLFKTYKDYKLSK